MESHVSCKSKTKSSFLTGVSAIKDMSALRQSPCHILNFDCPPYINTISHFLCVRMFYTDYLFVLVKDKYFTNK